MVQEWCNWLAKGHLVFCSQDYLLMTGHADVNRRHQCRSNTFASSMPSLVLSVLPSKLRKHPPAKRHLGHQPGGLTQFIMQVDFSLEARDNVLDVLHGKFSMPKAMEKLAYIHKVRNVFQYMRNPAHELLRWNQRETWTPDDDAFTFTIKSVMRNLCMRRWRPDRCFSTSLLSPTS